MNSLRFYRVKAHYSEETFSRLINISPTLLRKYEKDVQEIKLSTLQEVSKILDKTTEELLADPLGNILNMGERLKALREICGFTQRRLANEIDSSAEYISLLEESSYISNEDKILDRIAVALDIPLNLLEIPDKLLLEKALNCLERVLPGRLLEIYSGETKRAKLIKMLIDYKE